jgi:hypothetical protein
LFKPECEQQEKKWPEYDHQEHRVLTSVGRIFEIATNTFQLSTCVYTPLTGGGENMKEQRAHGTVGGLKSKEAHEARNRCNQKRGERVRERAMHQHRGNRT